MSEEKKIDCQTQSKSVKDLIDMRKKNKLDMRPVYQRAGQPWNIYKEQRLIDSLINGYDIPKFYLHKYPEHKDGKEFAVIDGQQRIKAISRFFYNKFPMRKNIDSNGDEILYDGIAEELQSIFLGRKLDVVIVTLDDISEENKNDNKIEEMFSRLNSGAPLSPAEYRNAFGGIMCRLVRTLADHSFFKNYVKFKDNKYAYYDMIAKFLIIELFFNEEFNNDRDVKDYLKIPYSIRKYDLKKSVLDNLVMNNRRGRNANDLRGKLRHKVNVHLNTMMKIFSHKDGNLAKGTTQTYYIFIRHILEDFKGSDNLEGLYVKIKKFINDFSKLRKKYNKILNEEGNVDSMNLDENLKMDLGEFSRIFQQAMGNHKMIKKRDDILKKYFLKWYLNQDN